MITVGTKNAIDSFDVIRGVNIQHTFCNSSASTRQLWSFAGVDMTRSPPQQIPPELNCQASH
jgi:hypothetical protein